MVEWHTKSRRKASGGLRRSILARDKKLSERGGDPALTKIAEPNQPSKHKTVKAMGTIHKVKALRASKASITDSKTNKTKVMEITTVKQNRANRLFVRRNIITQNAIIEAKDAEKNVLARVTSRPGQSGIVSAVLLTAEETRAFEAETAKKEPATESSRTTKTGKKAPKKAVVATEKTNA